MRFRTVGSLFIICALWTGMEYFSPKFTIYFWIFVALMIIVKGILLARCLQLNTAQNTLGQVMAHPTNPVE